ncbi:MAG: DUF4430 domain-containing protein [Ruminiclostridium sp.]|nr:DUF4430 domain-containing protein [Ruminiclostridium sp.]
MWLKKHKDKLLMAGLALVLLAAVYWYGGNAPGMQGWTVENAPAQTQEQEKTPPEETTEVLPEEPAEEDPTPEESLESRPGGTEGGMTAQEKEEAAQDLAEETLPREEGDQTWSSMQGMVLDPATGKDPYLTEPVPEGRPAPVEPENVTISDTAYTCTLTVRCDTILDNMAWLDPAKTELVPADGVILPETTVTFYEGESVFNILQREMKKAGIHLEFENTPIYNSAYIEGIANLYEFDCGELSGWTYRVNGWAPNYGCSRYQLQPGDTVEWLYTCKLGLDVGANIV